MRKDSSWVALRLRRTFWKTVASCVIVLGLVLNPFFFLLPFFQNTAFAAQGDGMIVYGEDTQVTPRYRTWNGTDLLGEASAQTPDAHGDANHVVVKSCPTRNEKIMGEITESGHIHIQIWNGSSWVYGTNAPANGDFTTGIGTTNDIYRGFDIAYEQTSGKAVVVYETTSTANQTIGYSTWNGTSWSSETLLSIPTGVNGVVYWARLEAKSGSNDIMLATLDSNSDIYAIRWNGSSWANGQLITAAASIATRESFDVAWESTSGEAMVMFGTGTTTDFWTFNGTTWTDGTGSFNPALTAHWIRLASDPTSNYIAMIMVDSGADVNVQIWDGSSWLAGAPTEDAATEGSAGRNVDVTWEKDSGKALFVFTDANALTVDYFTYTRSTSTWSVSVLTSAPTTTQTWRDDVAVLQLKSNPFSNEIMLSAINGATTPIDLRILRWNGSAWVQPTTYNPETAVAPGALNTPIGEAFMFTYDKYIPAGITASTDKSTDSWMGEVEIRGTLSGLNQLDYPYCRCEVTPQTSYPEYPATTYTSPNMTWDAVDQRYEFTYKIDTHGYGPGLADPRLGTYNVVVKLWSSSKNPDIDTPDYTSNTSFTTAAVYRWTCPGGVTSYTQFIPTWDVNHWNYSISGFGIQDTAARNNIIVKIPIYPNTSSISNVVVTGVSFSVDSYWWDAADRTICWKMSTINGTRNVNITFDSDTDLLGIRFDKYQTQDIGERRAYNGLLLSNQYLNFHLLGGSRQAETVANNRECAGEYVDLHVKSPTQESKVDCMERVGLFVYDAGTWNINEDTSGYYQANIKWKMTQWPNYITSQNNNEVVIDQDEDDDATGGWRQKITYGIDVHRKITFYASKKYIKNEYTFTNNGSSTREQLAMVWGREQWIEGPGGGANATNDRGIIPNNTNDYGYVNAPNGTANSIINGSDLTKAWWATYDTGSLYSAGEIFQDGNRPDKVWFHTGASEPNDIPMDNTAPCGVYPIHTSTATSPNAQDESHFFEKTWSSVGVSQAISFTLWHYGTYGSTRAGIADQYNTDCDNLNGTIALDINGVYSRDGSLDTTSPFDMSFGDVEPNLTYIIGETSQPYAVRLTVNSSVSNYNLTCKANGANFQSGANTIPVSRLSHAIHASTHLEGDWTSFSTSEDTLQSNHPPGTSSFEYDYRLQLPWDYGAADNFTQSFIYSATTI